jgi:hypothetical protein
MNTFDEILMQSSRGSFEKLHGKVHRYVTNTNHLPKDLRGPFKKNKGINSATCVPCTRKM